MKTALLIATALSVLTATVAQAQAPSRRARPAAAAREGTFVAPRNERASTGFTAQTPRADGVVPRAARSGNPLQMINPFAPAEYGSGQEVVRHEDADPDQNPRGIKFVTVEF